ncbi:MAG: HEAT repeat domain-containing protein [Planctomycetota bacterium]
MSVRPSVQLIAALLIVGAVLYFVLPVVLNEDRESLHDINRWLQKTKDTPPEELIALLEHSDPAWRRRAIEGLAIVGPKTDAVVPALIFRLEDSEASVRKAAASSLASMADAAVPQAVDPLLNRRNDPDPEVRVAVYFALSKMVAREPVRLRDPLIDGLKYGTEAIRYHAAAGLGELTEDDQALAALVDALDRSSADGAIARAIHAHGPRAIDYLELALDEPDRRLGAIQALRSFGSEAARLGQRIVEYLEPTSAAQMQRAIADAVTETGGLERETALPRLLPLLGSELTSVQMSGAKAIASLGDEVVPGLRRILEQRGPRLPGALRCLAVLAPPDVEIARLVVEILRDPATEPRARVLAARALGKMGADLDATLGALSMLLGRSTEPNLLNAAAMACADLGPPAIGALPMLVGALKETESRAAKQSLLHAITEISRPVDGVVHPMARNLVVPVMRELRDKEAFEAQRPSIDRLIEELSK